METYLLEKLEMGQLPRAVRGYLARSLAEYRNGRVNEMLALGHTAREIARGCGDSAAEAISLVFVGAALCQQSEFARAVAALDLARALFRRQPSWRHRRNEAIALYGLGLAFQRSTTPSIVETVASFQKALDVLENIRINYVVDGDDKNVDVIDELCAELRARIDAEVVAPIIDADYVVIDRKSGPVRVARLCAPPNGQETQGAGDDSLRTSVNTSLSTHEVGETRANGRNVGQCR